MTVRYLPRDIAAALQHELTDGQRAALGHGDGLFRIQRLLESAYASGYDEGHRRGRDEGYQHGRNDRDPVAPHMLLAVLRATGLADGDATVVTAEQIGKPGSVSVNQLTDGTTELVIHEGAR